MAKLLSRTNGRFLGKIFRDSSALVLLLAVFGWQMLNPQLLSASEALLQLSVQAQNGETYENLVERAVQVAKTAVEKAFAADLQREMVLISISGQHQGTIAPLLRLQVSRTQWQTQSETRQWATFYPSSKMLLGFGSGLPPTTPPAQQPMQPPVSGPVQPVLPKQPTVSGPVPVQPVPVDLIPGRPVTPQVIPGVPAGGEPVRLDQLPDNLLPGMSPQLPAEGTATEPVSTQPTTVEPTIVQPAMVQPSSVQPSSVQPGLILPSP
ncbi:hypothetical protein NG798_15665 [Ancylothrix sp. C2]|uniref:hypothetical protein n=1 Tax=Ancylothrix sp. D3o TaxID=2953691 RepID=UPI0021BA7095|nr:hypothetical protein [Ancylothrix sp. D3o]MCT7951237.1 hypothetical protein [Ancylothrix sp. D3o]